jgi:flagellar biosynthesis component FlhA
VRQIFTSKWTDPQFPALLLGLVMAVWVFQAISESKFRRVVDNAVVKTLLAAGMLVYLSVVPGHADVPFIYFQF